ncbi:MAG TPA: hypothetical protein VFR34_00165 [Paracoccaceae bacterium]|nr:hypothetical protein [Paracoccaceae bacterium]
MKFKANQTSAAFLVGVLESRAEAAGAGSDEELRHVLGHDIYIKAWSYAVLNKIAFWLAFVSCLGVLLWPVALVLLEATQSLSLIASALTQTMVTAIASFFILVYQHYKGRQTAAENLLRMVVFDPTPAKDLARAAIEEMAKIDKGVGFTLKSKPE